MRSNKGQVRRDHYKGGVKMIEMNSQITETKKQKTPKFRSASEEQTERVGLYGRKPENTDGGKLTLVMG